MGTRFYIDSDDINQDTRRFLNTAITSRHPYVFVPFGNYADMCNMLAEMVGQGIEIFNGDEAAFCSNFLTHIKPEETSETRNVQNYYITYDNETIIPFESIAFVNHTTITYRGAEEYTVLSVDESVLFRDAYLKWLNSEYIRCVREV